MRYSTILLDADMTIFDFDAAEKAALYATFADFGETCNEQILARYHIINKEFWARFERGEIAKTDIGPGRFTQLMGELGLPHAGKDINARYMIGLGEGDYLLEGARDFLDAVYGKVKLYLVTNGTSKTQYSRLKKAQLEQYFDGVFVSEDAGSQKPQKEYFDYVFSQIGEENRTKAVIVGDSLTSDILGGINAGIDSVWYNPFDGQERKDITPTFTATTYAQILAILELNE